jgi:HipA-like C-terminal domain
MNAPELLLTDTLRALLAQAPSLSMAQLQAATGKSQPSISNALAALGGQVHKLGAARSTRYALTKDILGLPAQQKLIWLGGSAHNFNFGTLTHLAHNGLHVRGADFESLQYDKLPWFLSSLRPQGFIGRELARLRPDFPTDPELWTVAQVLYMVINHVHDPSGAFILEGAESTVWAAPTELADRAAHYDFLANQTGKGLPAGSSAGGEQPKFVVRTSAGQHFIVKYSPPRGTPFGERWHELLHLEHLALQVLAEHGIATAETTVLKSATRTYLQSTRFDHIEQMRRRHVVAASAVHEEFVKTPQRHWIATCEALATQKRLSEIELDQVALQYLFGQYIGNTDMHFGNLSFFVDNVTQPQFQITPVYDMLPMQWRPGIHSGSLDAEPVRRQFQPPGFEAQAQQARQWAVRYWQRAANLPALSEALRQTCHINAQRLQTNFAEQ